MSLLSWAMKSTKTGGSITLLSGMAAGEARAIQNGLCGLKESIRKCGVARTADGGSGSLGR